MKRLTSISCLGYRVHGLERIITRGLYLGNGQGPFVLIDSISPSGEMLEHKTTRW